MSDYLRFWSPDTSALIEYHLGQFSNTPWIFNVSSPSTVAIIGGSSGGTTPVFRAGATAGNPSEYVAASPAAWQVPATLTSMGNEDLRGGNPDGADFVIVTSPDFLPAATALAAYRSQAAHGGLKTVVVNVNQVYNEFGGGLPDITAIRDYLDYAYNNWATRPEFVLFFGSASYDYKGILGSVSSFVPTWQTANSIDEVYSYCTDDFFVEFGFGTAPSMVVGRIPSRSLAEANIVVDKLKRYEESSVRDNWRMRTLFVADDAWTPETGYSSSEEVHSQQIENLSTNHTPDEIEKQKIFCAEYPVVISAQGRTEPGAYQTIIDDINQGCLIFNFAGHGNPSQLTHENVFNVQTSIPQLVNNNRFALFILAACNFSQYDDPRITTGSVVLLNKPDGGAIGAIASTRAVYAYNNAALNVGTFDQMFLRDAFGRLIVDRPATALYGFKAVSNSSNDQKFCYLGDPTMRLQFPSGYAAIDSINGTAVATGGTKPIQIKSLSHVTISGSIKDQNNAIDPSFNGTMELTVNDATTARTIVNIIPGNNLSYQLMGGIIFRGENTVSQGRFRSTFVVPKDITYADSTGRGRLVTYFHDQSRDGEGYTNRVVVSGTDTSVVDDHTGPHIALYLNSRSFRSGDLVGTQPTILVDLADSSGINTSTAGIGHRIESWLDDSRQSIDLTSNYTSLPDNYQQGTIQYPLGAVGISLAAGAHKIKVRAWDSYNNSSSVEAAFTVAPDNSALTIADVLNYPNPFGNSGTRFTFHQNQQVPINVRIRIYTLAGRMIQTLETVSSEPFIIVPWDGRDRDGDIIANGVYLYKVSASTTDGRFSSEALGKLAVAK